MPLSGYLVPSLSRPLAVLSLLAVAVILVAACRAEKTDLDLSVVYDERLGGDTTAFVSNRSAFEMSARNLNNELRRIFQVGDSFFNQNWVAAPASTGGKGRPWAHPQRPVLFFLSHPRRQGQTA